MAYEAPDRLSSLPLPLQKQIVSQPLLSVMDQIGTLPRISRSLYDLSDGLYDKPLEVTLRSPAHADQFAVWFARHGHHVRSLLVTIQGDWLSPADESSPHAGKGSSTWTRLWYSVLSAQSSGAQLQHLAIQAALAAPEEPGQRDLKTPSFFCTAPLSVVVQFPQQSLVSLDLSTSRVFQLRPRGSNKCAAPILSGSAFYLLCSLTGLQQLYISCDSDLEADIISLTQLTGLTELGIDNSPAVRFSGSLGVPVTQLVTSLTALCCLSLQLPCDISLALAAGLAGLTNLTRLHLRAFDDMQVNPAGATLSGLVRLQGLKQLTYEAPVVHLARVLPSLTTLEGLDFYADYLETPETNVLIAESALAPLQQLTRLSWDCSGDLEALASNLKQLSSLRELELRGNVVLAIIEMDQALQH